MSSQEAMVGVQPGGVSVVQPGGNVGGHEEMLGSSHEAMSVVQP